MKLSNFQDNQYQFISSGQKNKNIQNLALRLKLQAKRTIKEIGTRFFKWWLQNSKRVWLFFYKSFNLFFRKYFVFIYMTRVLAKITNRKKNPEWFPFCFHWSKIDNLICKITNDIAWMNNHILCSLWYKHKNIEIYIVQHRSEEHHST